MSQQTAPTTTAVAVGDFFVASWGYDQTNIDFYRVVAVSPSGKTVKVQQWQSTTRPTPGDFTHDWCAPGNGPRTGCWVQGRYDPDREYPVKSHRLRTSTWSGKEQTYFSVDSFAAAYRWDGEARYATAFGYGH